MFYVVAGAVMLSGRHKLWNHRGDAVLGVSLRESPDCDNGGGKTHCDWAAPPQTE